jgi:hypothetical protein
MRVKWMMLVATAAWGVGSFWACGDGGAEVAGTEGANGNGGAGQGQGGGFVGSGGVGGAGQGGSTSGGGVLPPTEIATCQGHVYECGDLIDNDMDGLLDSVDPECLGPCDDTEDSLYGGIPGQANPPCKQDCYFDQDGGPGNDDCYWSHECDDNEVEPNYYPSAHDGDACAHNEEANIPSTNLSCDELKGDDAEDPGQSKECLAYCGPLTPNGCDCFGCCEIPAASNNWIWLGSTGPEGNTVCTLAEADNPELCHPCEFVPSCLNECEECELCIGKTELPPGCTPGEGQCEGDIQPCGLPGQAPCAEGEVCISGCCQEVPS